ncbi:MAG: TnsA-like heteromeric transposase endonuclease subunit [Nakamurella sp.]
MSVGGATGTTLAPAAAGERKTLGREALATRSPDGLDLVQWRRGDGGLQTAQPSPGLLAERLWEALPIRKGSQYQNRRNQHGLHFWPLAGEHVWYESALELACLVELNYAGEAVQIAAMPFRLLFRTGATATYHDPDFFALHASGDQVLYDVKPAGRIDGKAGRQFAETARVCRRVGWRHQALTEASPVRAANLRFLRPARLPRCHPDADMFARLLSVFDGGRPVGQGAAIVDRHPALAMTFVKHLIWHRRLAVDLDRRLDFDTTATTGQGSEPCCA